MVNIEIKKRKFTGTYRKDRQEEEACEEHTLKPHQYPQWAINKGKQQAKKQKNRGRKIN